MRDRFVSPQVRILLERMDLYPEEFVHSFESRNIEPKWYGLLQNGEFGVIEKFLLKRKHDALRRKATQEMIMATIMCDEKPEEYLSLDTISRATKSLMNAPRIRMKQK